MSGGEIGYLKSLIMVSLVKQKRERETEIELTVEVVAPELAIPLGLCTGIGTLVFPICKMYNNALEKNEKTSIHHELTKEHTTSETQY